MIVQWNGSFILTGGQSWQTGQTYDIVYTLNTKQSEADWELRPHRLLIKRKQHFSFVLGAQLFVGCGEDQDGTLSSTLEVMDLTHPNTNWKLVNESYPETVNIKGIVHLNIIFSYMKVNKICNLDHRLF